MNKISNMKLCLILAILPVLECAESGITKSVYSNGCELSRSDIEDPFRDSMGMPYPFLNCSHLRKSSFNSSGIPVDIASISLANNVLTTFDPADILAFDGLKKLNLRSNKISAFKAANVTTASVSDIYLSDNRLRKVPTKFLCGFPKLSTIDLGNNQISAILDDDFSCFKNLAVLTLTSNSLGVIPDAAFRNVSNTLFALILSFTGLREVPAFLSSMPKIVYLSLSNNKITTIRANAFGGSPSLQWLELASNKISRIDGMAFRGSNKLRLLDLTDNRIEYLQPGVFDSMSEDEYLSIEMYENPLRCNCSLRWLKLWTDSLVFKDIRYKCEQPNRNHGKKSYELAASDFTCDPKERDWSQDCDKSTSQQTPAATSRPNAGNQQAESTLCPINCKCFNSKGVQYYPKGSSETSPNIGRRMLWYLGDVTFPHVDCSDAKLTTLPTPIRKDVKTLTMEQNSLGTIAIADLKSYSSLTILDLEGCGLTSIIPSAGVIFQNLTTLLLQHNKLTTLSRNHLVSFPKLKILRLYHNKIATFPKNLFAYNRFLNRLYIGSNPVTNFDSRCLDNLDLYSLSLRNMSLRQIPVIKSQNLTYFELSDNNITVIKNNTFRGTPTLFRLTMDNNRISTIEPAAFNKTTKLRYLDLSENKLTTLPQGVFNDLNPSRLHIELFMNRMYCDCNLRWLKTWIEDIEAMDPTTEVRFMCFRPWRIHGKKSDVLRPSDFICQTIDEQSKPTEDRKKAEEEYYVYEHGTCFGTGSIAAAVVLTFILTLLMVLIARWCFLRRTKRYSHYRAHDDAQLDMDM